MGRTAHRRAAGRAAPTPPLLTRLRPNTPRPLRGRRLPVFATSASVERLFSVSGQVVTEARLDPSTVTLLVFLHESIPGGIEREAYEIIETAVEIEDD